MKNPQKINSSKYVELFFNIQWIFKFLSLIPPRNAKKKIIETSKMPK